VEWTEDGLMEVARFAYEMNTHIENIGARRLHTVVEKITDDMSFRAHEYAGQRVVIDQAFVAERLKDVKIDRTIKGLL